MWAADLAVMAPPEPGWVEEEAWEHVSKPTTVDHKVDFHDPICR